MSEPKVIKQPAHLHTGADAVAQRPILAAHIGTIAHLATMIDTRMGVVFAEMIGAHQEAGLKIYLELKSARRQVTQRIAEDVLSESQLNAFNKACKKIRKATEKRDEIIHGVWYVSDDYPNGLVRACQKEATKGMVDYLVKEPSIIRHLLGPDITFWLYTEATFLSVEKRLLEAMSRLTNFQSGLKLRRTHPDLEDLAERLEQLDGPIEG